MNIYTYVVNQEVHSGKIYMFDQCALLGSLHMCRYFFSIRICNILTLTSLTLYIYGAPILDVSRSHTTTQHSR